jgi:hypothetical protein
MPYLKASALAYELHELVARQTTQTTSTTNTNKLQPNSTQIRTLIVAAAYILIIGILWCVRYPLNVSGGRCIDRVLKAYTLP